MPRHLWLIRITVNQSLMKLRKQRTHKEVSLDEKFESDGDALPLDIPDRAPNPEQLCWASELRDILGRTVEELRPILRTVFVLRDVEDSRSNRPHKCKLSQAAVKARLWRVRLHLRACLNRYFDERTPLAPEEPAPTIRVTKRMIVLFAECLRDSIPRNIFDQRRSVTNSPLEQQAHRRGPIFSQGTESSRHTLPRGYRDSTMVCGARMSVASDTLRAPRRMSCSYLLDFVMSCME